MKLHDMTIEIITPLALTAAGPLARLLNEIADRERAELEAQVEKRRRDENRQYEAEYYNVPVETLQRLDEMDIPWRRLVSSGPLPNNGFHADRASGPDNSEHSPETRPAGDD